MALWSFILDEACNNRGSHDSFVLFWTNNTGPKTARKSAAHVRQTIYHLFVKQQIQAEFYFWTQVLWKSMDSKFSQWVHGLNPWQIRFIN